MVHVSSVDNSRRNLTISLPSSRYGLLIQLGSRTRYTNNVLKQLYTISKGTMPMDVDFMLSDTFEQLRPNITLYKTFDEAVIAVDEMLATVAKSGPIEEDLEEGREDGRRNGGEEGLEEEEEGGESSGEDEEEEEGEVSHLQLLVLFMATDRAKRRCAE